MYVCIYIYIRTIVKTCKYTVTIVGIHTNVYYSIHTLLSWDWKIHISQINCTIGSCLLKEMLQLIITLVPVEYLSFLPRYRLGAAVQNVQHTMDLHTYVNDNFSIPGEDGYLWLFNAYQAFVPCV